MWLSVAFFLSLFIYKLADSAAGYFNKTVAPQTGPAGCLLGLIAETLEADFLCAAYGALKHNARSALGGNCVARRRSN